MRGRYVVPGANAVANVALQGDYVSMKEKRRSLWQIARLLDAQRSGPAFDDESQPSRINCS